MELLGVFVNSVGSKDQVDGAIMQFCVSRKFVDLQSGCQPGGERYVNMQKGTV